MLITSSQQSVRGNFVNFKICRLNYLEVLIETEFVCVFLGMSIYAL